MDQDDNTARRRVTKRLVLEISYDVGQQNSARGVFAGGVPDPEHMDELRIDMAPDLVYDERTDELIDSGKLQLNLRGSRRAYWAFARYLLTLCELETQDPDYHDHFDEILNSTGQPAVHMIVHRPTELHQHHRQ